MAAILDLVNFYIFKDLEKNAILFLITTMFQMGINKKSLLTNTHFARKYIRAYTITFDSKSASPMAYQGQTDRLSL